MTKIVSFCSFKGGTAKTSTCLHLGMALAKYHLKKVLLIDLDAQANLTFGLGLGMDVEPSIADVLVQKKTIQEVILATKDPLVHLVPANASLDGIESRSPIAQDFYGHERLKRSIKGLDYDFIFIDTPPSLGWLTQSALFAANFSLICAIAEPYSLMALNRLKEIHQQIKEHHPIEILGVILSLWDDRLSTNANYLTAINSALEGKLFDAKIRKDILVSRAALHGSSTFDLSKNSRASLDFQMLAEELLKRIDMLNTQGILS
jgi:chromosome partitioning protein